MEFAGYFIFFVIIFLLYLWGKSGIPLTCLLGVHEWSNQSTKARPGLHVDMHTNTLVSTQAYYKRCLHCEKRKLKKVLDTKTGEVLKNRK